MRMWNLRNNPAKFPTLGHWIGYAYCIARNACTDMRKSAESRHASGAEYSDETLESHARNVAEEFEGAALYADLMNLADDLWLGEKPADYRYRMLAANLVLHRQVRLQRVYEYLKQFEHAKFSEDPVTFMNWIKDPTIVRRLTYLVTHHSREELLRTMEERVAPTCDDEKAWMYQRYGLFHSIKKIVDNVDSCRQAAAEEFLGRCEESLPFRDAVERIYRSIKSIDDQTQVLCEPGLWKRLIFQYSQYELPLNDMVEWFGPPCQTVGFKFDQTKAHGWVYNKRLLKELREAYRNGEMGDE